MKLVEWRQGKGMTQDEVAEALGVGKPAIARWEAGTRDPSGAMKRKLFVLSDGAVEPNDFYDLPAWRKLLGAMASGAAALLGRKAA